MKSEFLKEVLSRFTDKNRATYELGLMAKRNDFMANQADGGMVKRQKGALFIWYYSPSSKSYICYREYNQETIATFHEMDYVGMSQFLDNFILYDAKEPIFCCLELPTSYSKGKSKLVEIIEENSGLKLAEIITRENSEYYLIKASYAPSLQHILNLVRNYLFSTPNKDVIQNRATLMETMFVIDIDPMEFSFTHL